MLGVLDVGGAGAIDGLAAIFPRTVVRLFDLFQLREQNGNIGREPIGMRIRKLQYDICQGEKLVVRWGTVGIREAIGRVLQIGDCDGGRWPLRGGFPAGDAEWGNWKDAIEELQRDEHECEEEK